MPKPRHARPRLYMLLLALCFFPGLSVALSFSWLKQQPDDTVFLITGIAGAVTIMASFALAVLHDSGMDEWERSNSRFSSFWGDAVGTSLVALLLSVPAGREWIYNTVTSFADVADPGQLVVLSFVGGFMTLCIVRVVCMAVLSIGWTFWKSRDPRGA